MYATADVSLIYSSALQILTVIIPLLTMRLFTEEKRQKTDQCLFTAPVGLFSIVFGKFLAACTVFLCGMMIFVVYALTLYGFAGALEWILNFGNFLGLFLLGTAYIAIGLFISCMTENQVVAAILSFIVNLLMFELDTYAVQEVSNPILQSVMYNVSFYPRYAEFASGILSIPSVVFFLSIIFVFNFLTVRVLERRRWA
jgi:ABC-2 type transport system permease protein